MQLFASYSITMGECVVVNRVLAFRCAEQYVLELNIHHALKILQQIVFLNGALNSRCPSLCKLSEDNISFGVRQCSISPPVDLLTANNFS